MRLLWGADDVLGRFISDSFPDLTSHSPYVPHAAVGIVNDEDEIVGGIAIRLLNSFDGSISIVLLPGAQLTRPMLRTMFTRAFLEIGLTRLSCSIAKGNKKSRRLAERIGFTLEGTKRRGYDGSRDSCLYGMLAENCRWIAPRTIYNGAHHPEEERHEISTRDDSSRRVPGRGREVGRTHH